VSTALPSSEFNFEVLGMLRATSILTLRAALPGQIRPPAPTCSTVCPCRSHPLAPRRPLTCTEFAGEPTSRERRGEWEAALGSDRQGGKLSRNSATFVGVSGGHHRGQAATTWVSGLDHQDGIPAVSDGLRIGTDFKRAFSIVIAPQLRQQLPETVELIWQYDASPLLRD
jgi:hypothetical protein